MDFTTLCLALASAVTILTYLAAFVFASRWRRRSSRASNCVFAALTLLTLSYAGRTIVLVVASRFMPASQLAGVSVGFAVIQSLMSSVAIALFVAAAFVDRDTPSQMPSNEYLPGDDKRAATSPNPYQFDEE